MDLNRAVSIKISILDSLNNYLETRNPGSKKNNISKEGTMNINKLNAKKVFSLIE